MFEKRIISANPMLGALAPGAATFDRIKKVTVSLSFLPLKTAISDAKVLTGRQKPLTEVAYAITGVIPRSCRSVRRPNQSPSR